MVADQLSVVDAGDSLPPQIQGVLPFFMRCTDTAFNPPPPQQVLMTMTLPWR